MWKYLLIAVMFVLLMGCVPSETYNDRAHITIEEVPDCLNYFKETAYTNYTEINKLRLAHNISDGVYTLNVDSDEKIHNIILTLRCPNESERIYFNFDRNGSIYHGPHDNITADIVWK